MQVNVVTALPEVQSAMVAPRTDSTESQDSYTMEVMSQDNSEKWRSHRIDMVIPSRGTAYMYFFIHQTFNEGHYVRHYISRTARVPAFLKLKDNAEPWKMHLSQSKQFRLKSKMLREEEDEVGNSCRCQTVEKLYVVQSFTLYDRPVWELSNI